VRAACARLGLARLPLVQLHWDDFRSPGYVDAARHLADCQRRGLIGAWGVCNWDLPRLLELIDAGLTPATNQVCLSVLDRRAATFLPPVCEAHSIKLLAYGTMAGGFLDPARFLNLPAAKCVVFLGFLRGVLSFEQNTVCYNHANPSHSFPRLTR
jgi:diketogulonate reductase-like aldo/keto reductase